MKRIRALGARMHSRLLVNRLRIRRYRRGFILRGVPHSSVVREVALVLTVRRRHVPSLSLLRSTVSQITSHRSLIASASARVNCPSIS